MTKIQSFILLLCVCKIAAVSYCETRGILCSLKIIDLYEKK